MRWISLLLLLICTGLGTGCSLYKRAVLNHQYKDALELYDEGSYGLATAAFESLVDKYPTDSPEREEIVFLTGRAHYYLKNYHDAAETIQSYIEFYPTGRHQSEAAQDLVTIAAATAAPNPVAEERLQEARNNLETLKSLAKEFPTDPRIKYYMGNLYWELGNYKRAGRLYFEAQALEAAYQEKELIKKRLFINENGEPEALTPGAIQAIEIENNPLVVFDQMTYYQRQNTDAWSARQVYYNITGKVRNQGQETLRNVVIEVRFQNAHNQLLDFNTIPIGTLRPGDVRPFLAQASQYDHLLNITHVDIHPRHD